MQKDALILSAASAYYNAAILALNMVGADPKAQTVQSWEMMLPYIMNAAFSCELALKSLLTNPPKDHKLDALLECLRLEEMADNNGADPTADPDSHYNYLLQQAFDNWRHTQGKHYKDMDSTDKADFLKQLNINSSDFVDVRYIHEGGLKLHEYKPGLLLAITEAILEDNHYEKSVRTGFMERHRAAEELKVP